MMIVLLMAVVGQEQGFRIICFHNDNDDKREQWKDLSLGESSRQKVDVVR